MDYKIWIIKAQAKFWSTPPLSVWHVGVCSLLRTYLPCFGRGLNVRDAVGAGEFLGLPRVHRACWEVTFVSNKHHWNIV